MADGGERGAPGQAADAVAPDCEGCGKPLEGEVFVWSPYEADDGGAYCTACAGRAWASDVETMARERRRTAQLERRIEAAFELLDLYQQEREDAAIPGDDPVDQAIAMLKSEDSEGGERR